MTNSADPKILPHDLEAEQDILRAIIQDKRLSLERQRLLKDNPFYNGLHRRIYRAMMELQSEEKEINYDTLFKKLDKKDILDETSQKETLAELNRQPISGFDRAFGTVREHWQSRESLKLLEPATENLYNDRGRNFQEIIQTLIQGLTPISAEAVHERLKTRVQAQKEQGAESIFAALKAHYDKPALKTGWSWLDDKLRFLPESLNIIQSESNHGKSKFMLNLLYSFALSLDNHSTDCLFITYERSTLKLEETFLNAASMRDSNKLMIGREPSGEYYFDEKNVLIKSFNEKKAAGELALFDNLAYEELPTLIKEYKRPGRTLVLFIDYIQLLAQQAAFRSTGWELIRDVAYGLEKLAVQESIIIFAASQVNAQGETREGKDIYNAASNVIDIFNHSHAKIKQAEKPRKPYKDKFGGKMIITLTIDKSKDEASAFKEDYLLFDGHSFIENPNAGNSAPDRPAAERYTTGGKKEPKY